jgi:hypothetical protein
MKFAMLALLLLASLGSFGCGNSCEPRDTGFSPGDTGAVK